MPKSKLSNLINEESNIVINDKKKSTKNVVSKTSNAKKTSSKASLKSGTKKIATKATSKNTSAKKVMAKATSKDASPKKVTTKTTSKNTSAKKSNTTKSSKLKTNSRKKSIEEKQNSPLSEVMAIKHKKITNIVEYYDLPYTYDKTVVKVLYQNPNTLFVYWDISKKDINNFKKLYGEDFLNITSPVLIVHNKTKNYTFEIKINDFANNWYIHVNEPKCKYEVKLGRRPSQAESIKNEVNGTYDNFVNITSSNTIEMPNDHVLFYKNNQVLTFKNIKTNEIKNRIYTFGNNLSKNIKKIYNNFKLDEIHNSFDLKNPSSNNPTSGMM